MTGPKRARMSAVDTAWLRMDRPGNLMMISGVLVFGRHVRYERVKRVIRERFLRFPRFRQRPVQASRRRVLGERAGFLDRRSRRSRCRFPVAPGTKELQALVSRLASRPLDPARPLWQFHLVDNFAGGSALIARIHHCYADGIALVRVVMSMTDAAPNGPPAMPFHRRRRARDRRKASDDPLAELLQPISGVMKIVRKVGATLIEKGAAIWNDPAKAVALAEQGGALTAELAKLALMPQDSPTRFKGKPGVAKRGGVGRAAAARRHQDHRARHWARRSTTCCCPASPARSREYLAQKGDATEGVMVRALVPVNLRPLEEAYRLGNQFGLVFLDLPIGIGNPVERLYAVRANMTRAQGKLSARHRAGPARGDGRRDRRCCRRSCCRRWRATARR